MKLALDVQYDPIAPDEVRNKECQILSRLYTRCADRPTDRESGLSC